MERTIVSSWRGSATTAEQVREQILERWGQEEASNYDPRSNCLTFSQWRENGYKVKYGEKAIKSFTIIEQRDKTGDVVRRYVKTISLFYVRQVEKIG